MDSLLQVVIKVLNDKGYTEAADRVNDLSKHLNGTPRNTAKTTEGK
jgi:UDP:flavonoid glycosyltransferase YjiC (YdhE family)